MVKNKSFNLLVSILVLFSYQGVAQSTTGDAIEAVVNGLQVDVSEIEIYGSNLSLNEGDLGNEAKVLVDHTIVYEAIRPTSGRNFFMYKRIDKIVYLMPIPNLETINIPERSMVDN